jgi:hypothetical protein
VKKFAESDTEVNSRDDSWVRGVMAIDYHRSAPRRAKYVAAPIFAALALGACGGSTAVESAEGPASVEGAPSVPTAAETAAVNEDTLQSADNPFDIEVLSVADGTVSSLREVVTGDRPVLVWFWAPH